MASKAVLLRPCVGGLQIIQFRSKEVGQSSTIDRNDPANDVLKTIWANDFASPESTTNSVLIVLNNI